MKDAKLQPPAVLMVASILFVVSGYVWAQATPPSSQRPFSAEQSKSAPPATEAAPSPASAIDPDVKQWFLERMRQRRPYDPKDVEVSTGRARDLEQEREAQYRWNSWAPYALGAGTPYAGRWNAFDRPDFARPEFFSLAIPRSDWMASFLAGRSLVLGGIVGVLVRLGDDAAENVGRAKTGSLSTTRNPVGKSKVVVVV